MFLPFLSKEKRIFQKMGYFADQEGIMRRYICEAKYWELHLNQTKEFILNSAQSKIRNKVAVLGSGWLLDVPLEELSSRFKEVWLYDIKHPYPVQSRAMKLENVKLVETDISGFASSVYYACKKAGAFNVHELSPAVSFDLRDFDFVVSCNMLNQLDILLIDYIRQKTRLEKAEEQQLREKVQQFHLSLLPQHKSCVVSDVEELTVSMQGEIVQARALVFEPAIFNSLENSWMWHFDNSFTYRSGYNTWFKVVAVNL
jgi:hypothetical protein